jgi:hypothetical protein
MTAMVERAGGRVLRAVHRTKPRYLLRSAARLLRERSDPLSRLGRALLADRAGRGLMKLALELTMPIARPLHRGEAVRYFITHA